MKQAEFDKIHSLLDLVSFLTLEVDKSLKDGLTKHVKLEDVLVVLKTFIEEQPR